jgi:hypothetical protein
MRLLSLWMVAGLISVSALGAAGGADAQPRPLDRPTDRYPDSSADHRYKTLLAEAIRRHTPRHVTIGGGEAFCFFRVGHDGGVIIVTATGSSPAHAMLARRVIESVRAPPPPNGAFNASQSFHFY